MASIAQSKISVPNKKDSTVAIVIGQQRRVSETKNPSNVPETTLKSTELSKEISKSLDLGLHAGSSLEVISSQTRKKFLINDILQQKSLQEQSLPPSHNRLHLMSLLNIGINNMYYTSFFNIRGYIQSTNKNTLIPLTYFTNTRSRYDT